MRGALKKRIRSATDQLAMVSRLLETKDHPDAEKEKAKLERIIIELKTLCVS